MVSMMKSPNIMSTMGRRPVMAAPTATPVKPASEIGVSSTRSVPNSSTSPESTLKGVPASATSSPRMQTRGSRRISSASASLTACAKVSSRTRVSGINVLLRFFGFWIRSSDRKIHRSLHLRANIGFDGCQSVGVCEFFSDQPSGEKLNGVAFSLPLLLLLLGTVIFAVDVADMVSRVAISIAKQKRGAFALARAFHQARCGGVDGADVLSIDTFRRDAEGLAAGKHVSGSGFGEMRIFGIVVVFTGVNYRQFPERGEVHYFINDALAERALAKKADGYLALARMFRGKRGTGGNTRAAGNDGVRAKVSCSRISNVH